MHVRQVVRPVTALGVSAALVLAAAGAVGAAQPQVSGLPSAPTAALTASSSAAADYSWSNVEIVGGGFVPALVFNQAEPGLVYARTDIGGAYRFDNQAQRWVPLTDHVGWDDWGHNGILSLATDPVDPDRVYVAAGTYTNSWDPNNGAIMRSTDRGETWQTTELPFKVGGNMPGRGMGERLAVDPNKNSVLYYGAESGNGLWRSTDFGATWAEVTSFPNPGSYVQDPSYDYTADNQGVVWVTFDPTSATAGDATRTIYVGVADKDNPVYRSTDAGATWEAVPGAPTGYLPHKGVLDHEGGQLYIATSDTGGPYDGAKGDVWRLDTASGEWTQISPVPSSSPDAGFGYAGLSIDRQNPDTLVVTTQMLWWPDINMYRSTDRGETWTPIWEWSSYPSRTLRYTQDISGAPWLDFGRQSVEPELSPKLGWMTESFEIDPFDSDHALYGTGATVYGTDNLTAWDTGGKVAIDVRATGIEETAVLDLAAPPGPVELYSGLGDIGGFVHTDVTQVPDQMYSQPFHGSVTGIDVAALKPATVVRVGQAVDGEVESHIGISTSSGSSWWAGQEPAGVTGGGTVAVSADGGRIVWSPDGAGVHVSTTLGSSWTASTGVPDGARVESDRVDPDRFYAFADGRFYLSTDGGASFTASSATGLPTEGNIRFAAVPGVEGDVWLAGGATGSTYGMWRSTDGGATFDQLDAVDEGDVVGFGKAAPGRTYPAVYTSSRIDGVRGIFRSDDAGETWVRINDDEHQWAWTGGAITGDPDVYGRVYVGTNGRGVVMGSTDQVPDPEPDPDPTPDPTPDPDPTTDPEPDPDPTTDPEPDPDPTTDPDPDPLPGDCAVRYSVNQWNSGFTASVRITNTGTAPITGWSLDFTFPADQQVVQAWSGLATQTGSDVTISNAPWNGTIQPGGNVEIGFNGSHTGQNPQPEEFTVNGTACTRG